MAKRLKCWRKIKDKPRGFRNTEIYSRRRKHGGTILDVHVKTSSEGWRVTDEGNRDLAKESKTKKEAERKAKIYMRKHDRC